MNALPSPKMVLYKVSLVLAVITVSVNADFHYERFKAFNFHGDDSLRKPWFLEGYASPYKQEPTDVAASYASPYENPAEAYFAASTKKIPNEDKSFKKAISPFYSISDNDHEKYKSIVLKSGVPYCQETKSNGPPAHKRYRRDAMTCYKCKDPKNGATYERCSYTSEPQESVQIEDYVAIPSTFRYRRSNTNVDASKVENSPITGNVENDRNIEEPYRFGEEYFAPEASHEIPTEDQKQIENCDKVVKGSMVCMVCKDPKTNGKYEQCSYTTQPNEKAFSYIKSKSFGTPQPEEKTGQLKNVAPNEKRDYSTHENTENSKPDTVYGTPARYTSGSGDQFGATNPEVDEYFKNEKFVVDEHVPQYKTARSGSGSDESVNKQSDSESVTSGNCKKYSKDSMTCTVCKDPKTGGNYEQCSYAYKPNDKVYQFSKQKSFGYPGAGEQEATGGEYNKGNDKSEEPSQSRSYDSPTYTSDASPNTNYRDYNNERSDKYYQPQETAPDATHGRNNQESSYYQQPTEKRNRNSHSVGDALSDSGAQVKSESEKITDEIKSSDCHKVEKDSMTCMVCKDPKNGGSYEQCSHAYQPNDKLYSFSRSKSFGTPNDGGDSRYTQGDNPHGSYRHSDYTNVGGHGFANDNKPYGTSDDTRREKYNLPDEMNKNRNQQEDATHESKKTAKAGTDFFSTSEKKQEIEKVLQEFEKEDRSKCKKVIRDKMTCYQCADEQGFQKEECMFVTAAQPTNNRLAYHERKEFKLDPTAASSSTPEEYHVTKSSSTRPFSTEVPETVNKKSDVKQKKVTKRRKVAKSPVEPSAAASETHVKRAKPETESPEAEGVEPNDKLVAAEPYDYAAETRSRFDKVLGLKLPEYMLATSEHEAEFDEMVAASTF